MNSSRLSSREWGERILLALFFAIVGLTLTAILSPFTPMLDKRTLGYLGRIGLTFLLAIAILIMKKTGIFAKYLQIVQGLFIMSLSITLIWVFGMFILESLPLNENSILGYVLPKVQDMVIVYVVVLFFTRVFGNSFGSVFIQKGNLKLGLWIGIIAFLVAAAGSIPMAKLLFNATNLTLDRVVSWAPYILIFVLANAAMEELLFRGLFLKKLEPFYGKFLSNFLIALIFTGLHGMATYTSDKFIFLAVLLPLALLWGYVMQKTDSIWGSILFHAGMDIPIMLGIFSNF
ncbi:MAG: type II CAAX endopeptidase family protein [Anaerolineaceae bacterium]